MMETSFACPVLESSQVGEARRSVTALSTQLGFSETERGQLSIIATELANNLVKHTNGKGGQLVVRSVQKNSPSLFGIEILSLDTGPGMRSVAECLRDGYSTAGSPGTGLGAVHRLSHVFDIYSAMGMGTAVLAQVWNRHPSSHPPDGDFLEVGSLSLPMRGEKVCGDQWSSHQEAGLGHFLMADGLGHGILAFEAARESVQTFQEYKKTRSPSEILKLAHDALRRTRGATLAIATVDVENQLVRFVGIGNISGTVILPDLTSRSMVSHNGTVGMEIRKIQEFQYPWIKGSLLILHSDGLVTHWKIDRYPGLSMRHPSLIAGILYRDFSRGNDDVTVVVTRHREC